MAADLVIIAGNPAPKLIDDIEIWQLVFKDGLGFDPGQLTNRCKALAPAN